MCVHVYALSSLRESIRLAFARTIVVLSDSNTRDSECPSKRSATGPMIRPAMDGDARKSERAKCRTTRSGQALWPRRNFENIKSGAVPVARPELSACDGDGAIDRRRHRLRHT
jgi:hypothetical protein